MVIRATQIVRWMEVLAKATFAIIDFLLVTTVSLPKLSFATPHIITATITTKYKIYQKTCAAGNLLTYLVFSLRICTFEKFSLLYFGTRMTP